MNVVREEEQEQEQGETRKERVVVESVLAMLRSTELKVLLHLRQNSREGESVRLTAGSL